MSRPVRRVRHVPRTLTAQELAAALVWALFALVGGGACIWALLGLLGVV